MNLWKALGALFQSFKHAYLGLVHVWLSQRNMRVDVTAGYLVFVLASWLDFDPVRTLIVLLTVGAVLVAELFNTAIEAVVDLATSEFHPRARIAKDVAASAVLTTSLLSVVVAAYVFGPELSRLPRAVSAEWAAHPGVVYLHAAIFAFLLVTSFSHVQGE